MEKAAGEIVFQEQPYVHILSSQMRGELCDYCFDRIEKLKTCSSCHVLRYCHRKCQQLDWGVHKLECKCLKNVSPEIPTDSVRLLLRLLIRHKVCLQSCLILTLGRMKLLQQTHVETPVRIGSPKLSNIESENGDHEKLFNDDPLWRRPFQDLMSHSIDIKTDEERSKQFHYILNVLPTLIGQCFLLPSAEILWETFGKMVINSCSIQDEEHKDILGTGIYLGASRIDHSCDPNAVFTFSGTEMTVRAIDYITKAEPQQLFMSYIDTRKPSWERKEELRGRYYFHCQCSMCTTKCEEIDRIMSSIKCPNSECDGFVGLKRNGKHNSVWPCIKCQKILSTPEEIEHLHKTWDESCSHRVKLNELYKQGDMKSTLRFAEDKLNYLIRNHFHKSNVNLIEIMDFAKDACIQLGLWEKAADYTGKVSNGIFQIFPSINISVGLSFLKLGKLQLYLDRTQKAANSLKVAEKILRVTHGPSHTVYQLLVDLQQQCQMFLAN